MDPRRKAELDAAYARKMAARRDGTANAQTYPANRASGTPAVDSAYRAKMDARIAAFSAGRKPDANGFLDVSPAKVEAPKPVLEKTDDEKLEEATRPDPKAKPAKG